MSPLTSIYDDYLVLAGETDDGQKLKVKLRVDPVTHALIVTGAGAAPAATSLRIKDGILDQWAKVDAQGHLHALMQAELASKVMIWTDVHALPDTELVEKLRYIAIAPSGTLLTDAKWLVGQFFWSRRGPALYKLTSVRSQDGISLLASGTDSDPWNAVKTRLDGLVWNL